MQPDVPISSPSAAQAESPTEPVQAVGRVVALLRLLATAGPRGLALRDLSDIVGRKRSTVHSLLRSLLAYGLVEQTPERNYQVGPEVLQLAGAYLSGNRWIEVLDPVLAQLHAITQETIHLAVRQGDRSNSVRHLPGLHPVVASASPIREPRLYCTSVGKVLLAAVPTAEATRLIDEIVARGFVAYSPRTITSREALERELDRVRLLEYASNMEEGRPGVVGHAAPVRDYTGATVAALGVMYPAVRSSPEYDAEMTKAVRAAAADASGRLGRRQAITQTPTSR